MNNKKKKARLIRGIILAVLVGGTILIALYYSYGQQFIGTVSEGGPFGDPDKDGLFNSEEIETFGTNPRLVDTDMDGEKDGDEIWEHKTNALLKDTDNDRLNDGDEIKAGTDPKNRDSDGDGVFDATELEKGTNPLDAKSISPELEKLKEIQGKDTDGDGLSDFDEKVNYLTNSEIFDTDGDGWTDQEEIILSLDPLNKDLEKGIIRIINIKDGDVLNTLKPTMEILAPEGYTIVPMLTNEFGHVARFQALTGGLDTDIGKNRGKLGDVTYKLYVTEISGLLDKTEFYLVAKGVRAGGIDSSLLKRVRLDTSVK